MTIQTQQDTLDRLAETLKQDEPITEDKTIIINPEPAIAAAAQAGKSSMENKQSTKEQSSKAVTSKLYNYNKIIGLIKRKSIATKLSYCSCRKLG